MSWDIRRTRVTRKGVLVAVKGREGAGAEHEVHQRVFFGRSHGLSDPTLHVRGVDNDPRAVAQSGFEGIVTALTPLDLVRRQAIECAHDLESDRREAFVQLRGEIGPRCLPDDIRNDEGGTHAGEATRPRPVTRGPCVA